jgi:L-fuculose-phosphate aldolase
MRFEKERREVARYMKRLVDRKLATVSGGNVSHRIGDLILITASQTDKAKMQAREIGIMSMDGRNLTPGLKPSMETKMHLSIYENRKNVQAIVHAHPVFATSFAITGKEIKTDLAGEARAVLGIPVFAEYALMGTSQLAEAVSTASLKSNVILMKNHGIITLGSTLLQAYDRMEVLEATAKITVITSFLGDARSLTQEELKTIDELFE